MRRLLESLYAFTVPADPQNREWARRAAPLEIHERVSYGSSPVGIKMSWTGLPSRQIPRST